MTYFSLFVTLPFRDTSSERVYIFGIFFERLTERDKNSSCERLRLINFPVFIPSGVADISVMSHRESGTNVEKTELERSILSV